MIEPSADSQHQYTYEPAPAAAPPAAAPAVTPATPLGLSTSWQAIRARAHKMGMVFLILAILVGLAGGYVALRAYLSTRPKVSVEKTPAVGTTKLSQAELERLGATNVELGGSGNLLTVSANSNFTGKVNIASDATITGNLTSTGTGAFSNLNAPGTTNLGDANVNSNFKVSGASTLQGNVNAASGLSIGKNLSVAGTSSFAGRLSAGSIAGRDGTFNGPLTVNGHYISQGSTPSLFPSGNLGGGGTASASGNDTAGTIVINAGTGAGTGLMVTLGFRSGYGATPRVSLTPTSAGAAGMQYYVIKNASGFSIYSNTAPSGTASFDYFVAQ